MSRIPRLFAWALACAVAACAATAAAQPIEVLWLGHATFRLTSPSGKVIVIDPFLKRNPKAPPAFHDLAAIGKVDLILVTHGHPDHISDLPELAKLTGARVVANYELANNLVALNLLDANRTIPFNKGGSISPIGPGIKVHMVQAEHSSSIDMTTIEKTPSGPRYIEGGTAVGYVVEFENGYRIYHTGDTDVFGDMALIGRLHKPDLVLACIGGHFTMGPEGAAYALRDLLKAKQVVPMHYATFPATNRTPAELKTALGNAPVKVIEMKPGEPMRF